MDESNDRATIPSANLEQASDHELLAEETMPRFDSPVHIRVISYRKRNTDPDGISVKAVLDGLVRAELLADDSAKQVKSITFENRASKEERTIIEITSVD